MLSIKGALRPRFQFNCRKMELTPGRSGTLAAGRADEGDQHEISYIEEHPSNDAEAAQGVRRRIGSGKGSTGVLSTTAPSSEIVSERKRYPDAALPPLGGSGRRQ